jgi:hypothetical protein
VEKCCTAGQATDVDIIQRKRIACWIPKAIVTHTITMCNIYCNDAYTKAPICNVIIHRLSCLPLKNPAEMADAPDL